MTTARALLLLGAAWLGAAGTLAPALAQTLPGAVQPGRDRPLPQTPTQPDFDFRLEAPQRSPVPRAVDELHFVLNDIRIVGAKVIATSAFRPLYASLIGKNVSLSNILDVADAIEQEYRARGYLLVRAYVPPQRVKDGIFTINVSEGFVTSASVEGGNAGTQEVTNAYLTAVTADRPLELSTIERALLLTNDLPGVTATGVLRPSATTPGASDLVVTESQPPMTGGLAIDNRGSRFSGLWTVTGDAEFNGLFGADQLAATVTSAPDSLEQIQGQLRYRRAIGDDGLIGSMIGTVTHGEPGSTLSQFNVRTDSWAVGPRLTYPIERSRAETISLDGGLTVQDARVDILGSGISHDQWRVFDIGVSYLHNDFLGMNWAATIDVAQGLPFLGATPNHSLSLSRPDGLTDFTKITAAAHMIMPLGNNFAAAFSTQGQFSFAPLITGEQIAYGGTQIGRGYDPGAITGDHGLGSSVELHYDSHLPEWSIGTLEPYIFVDSARTWYIHGNTTSLPGESIASTGGGIRFWLPWNATFDIEADRTLRPVPGSDGGKLATKVLIDASIRF